MVVELPDANELAKIKKAGVEFSMGHINLRKKLGFVGTFVGMSKNEIHLIALISAYWFVDSSASLT